MSTLPPKQTAKVFRILLASLPLIFLVVLMLTRAYAARAFVLCEAHPCESIAANLNKVLIADNPATRAAAQTDSPDDKKKKDLANAEVTGSIYSGRLNWLFLTIAYLIISLVGTVIGCRIIYRPVQRTIGKRLAIGLFLASAFGVILYWYPEFHMPLMLGLIPKTLKLDIPNVGDIINATNSFGFAAAFLVSASVVSLLLEVERKHKPSLDELSQAMRRLRVILYVGTVMLVIGMLFERSLFQWSLAFLSREEQAQKAAQNFFAAIVAVDGGFYTILLAAVYLPAALIIRLRAEEPGFLPSKEADREKALKEHALDFSFSESLPRLLAILAPLLAGPIGELFGRLAK